MSRGAVHSNRVTARRDSGLRHASPRFRSACSKVIAQREGRLIFVVRRRHHTSCCYGAGGAGPQTLPLFSLSRRVPQAHHLTVPNAARIRGAGRRDLGPLMHTITTGIHSHSPRVRARAAASPSLFEHRKIGGVLHPHNFNVRRPSPFQSPLVADPRRSSPNPFPAPPRRPSQRRLTHSHPHMWHPLYLNLSFSHMWPPPSAEPSRRSRRRASVYRALPL